MARNRGRGDRDAKQDEIVRAAARLFSERGVDGSSMTAIADAAGITKNTVYWYFRDKDELLLEVLADAIRSMRAGWDAEDTADLSLRLQGLVGAFAEIEHLTAALHARARVSEQARAWHERFHERSDVWLRERIGEFASLDARAVDPGLARTTARLWALAIDAMVTHRVPDAEREAVCNLLVDQLGALTGTPVQRGDEDSRRPRSAGPSLHVD